MLMSPPTQRASHFSKSSYLPSEEWNNRGSFHPPRAKIKLRVGVSLKLDKGINCLCFWCRLLSRSTRAGVNAWHVSDYHFLSRRIYNGFDIRQPFFFSSLLFICTFETFYYSGAAFYCSSWTRTFLLVFPVLFILGYSFTTTSIFLSQWNSHLVFYLSMPGSWNQVIHFSPVELKNIRYMM